MDKQLLEQALKALEVGRKVWSGEDSYRPHIPDSHAVKAITAIRARLEQPEQEPVATVIGKYLDRRDVLYTCIDKDLPLLTPLYTTPPAAQEEIQRLSALLRAQQITIDKLEAAPVQEPPPECQTEAEKRAYAFGWWKALEANIAAQRQWIGLTLTEIDAFEKGSRNRRALICAIEAKLKEKNT